MGLLIWLLFFFPFPWELLVLALVTCLTQARPSVMMRFAIHLEQATGKMTRLAVSYKNTHKSQLSPTNPPDEKRGLWLKLPRTETSLGWFPFMRVCSGTEGRRSAQRGGKLAMPTHCTSVVFQHSVKFSWVAFLCLWWWNRFFCSFGLKKTQKQTAQINKERQCDGAKISMWAHPLIREGK